MNNVKPEWIKVKAISEESYSNITEITSRYALNTVCQSANCPNMSECWKDKTATFLLMGDICTRNCKFCSVKTGNPKGILDNSEPENIAKAAKELNLKYAVLTSVDRDDLKDKGSEHFARSIREIKKQNPEIIIEALIPDFSGDIRFLENVTKEKPDIIGHNIETTERLGPVIRDKRSNFHTSLQVLNNIKKLNPEIYTKSSILLGFGETDREIKQTLFHLIENVVDIVTIGQYLMPTNKQIPVQNYIHPDKFREYKEFGEDLGFLMVMSGPFVRSSYKSYQLFSSNAFIAGRSIPSR